jgi:hypothetical protein
MKAFVALTVVLLVVTPVSLVAGTTCVTATVVPADGRIVDFDFVANGTSNFYQFRGVAGRSYSVEVRENYDDPPSTVTVTLTSNGGVSGGCSAAVPNTKDTAAAEPVLPANAFRRSFIAAATGTFGIEVQNTGSQGRYISVSVADTTLFCPRWSTFGVHTEWGFTNTTGLAISGVFTLIRNDGSVQAGTPITINIAANGAAFADTRNVGAGNPLNIPNNQFGKAVFAHDGPPGAIIGDSYIIDAGFPGGPFIQPGKFETARQSR